jgi:hypothetical protein
MASGRAFLVDGPVIPSVGDTFSLERLQVVTWKTRRVRICGKTFLLPSDLEPEHQCEEAQTGWPKFCAYCDCFSRIRVRPSNYYKEGVYAPFDI